MRHVPVLAKEVVKAFENTKIASGTYVDLTLGLAGHASIITTSLRPKTVIGVDRDKDMLAKADALLRESIRTLDAPPRLRLYHANYSDFPHAIDQNIRAEAILLDLGVASPHFDDPSRGMSFRFDSPLDMRLDRTQTLTAATVVNTFTEAELGRILRDYGEERHWRAIARRICSLRHELGFKQLSTTKELVDVVSPILGPRIGRIHPATKVFQAIRMAVNDELHHLQLVIPQAIGTLVSGGKLAIITFHSLEDRIVKQEFSRALESGLAEHITKNPIEAKKAEIAENARSRSAKLRILTKK